MQQYIVYNHNGERIGTAYSFGEAKKMHQNYFNKIDEDGLGKSYAGLDCAELRSGFACPVFYAD